jgi:hypothetical protein
MRLRPEGTWRGTDLGFCLRRAFAHLTKSDAHAIAVYLKSLPRVSHQVPGPFGPDDKASVFLMKVVPPEAGAKK